MRAHEFIIENIQPPESLKTKLVYRGWNFDVAIDGATVSVIVLSDFDNPESQIAYVVLDRDGRNLKPEMLSVGEKFRSQGIASAMYDYLKELGFRIHRIPKDQTRAGKGFWQHHRGDLKVWENVDEAFTKSTDSYADMVYNLGDEQKSVFLGRGAHGNVYTHPTQDTTVIKIFANDRGYAEWLRWIAQHQSNRYVPKIIPHPDGSIIKLYKYYKQGNQTAISQRMGVVHLERLSEITGDELYKFSKQILSYLDPAGYNRIVKLFQKLPVPSYFDHLTNPDDWHVISLNAETAGDTDLAEVADFFSRQEEGRRRLMKTGIKTVIKTGLDLGLNNIMKRSNGELVFVDPLVGLQTRRSF